VADFGLAKLVGTEPESGPGISLARVEAALTEAGKVMGTPAYMAPEQGARPNEVDHRADIYALGVVFYQLLTGELPRKPLEPPSRRVQIDVRLDEVVLKAMQAAPERRYEQASQLKTAVEDITSGSSRMSDAPAHAGAEGARIQEVVHRLKSAPPRWWQVFLAGFLTVVLLEFGALAFTERGVAQLILALLAGGVAVTIFLIARQVWLTALLVGLLIAFLSWLTVMGAAMSTYVLPAAAGLAALGAYFLAMRKLGLSRAFLTAFMAVFLLLLGASAIITFLMPESFSATARISVLHGSPPTVPYVAGQAEPNPYFMQTEMAVLQSTNVLEKVLEDLNLVQKWSERLNMSKSLSRTEALELLKSRMQLRPVRNSSVLEIRVFDEAASEAAAIANEIAQVFRGTRLAQVAEAGSEAIPVKIAIVDMAVPPQRPVRPNKPLNLTIGALAGLLLGTMAGAAFAGYKTRNTPAPL
jgi:capsular polysaccharide biosynthesis protein